MEPCTARNGVDQLPPRVVCAARRMPGYFVRQAAAICCTYALDSADIIDVFVMDDGPLRTRRFPPPAPRDEGRFVLALKGQVPG